MGVEVAGQDNSLVLVAGQQDHQRHAVEGQRETWQTDHEKRTFIMAKKRVRIDKSWKI